MKNLKYFFIALMAIAVTACGSKNSEKSESSDPYADETTTVTDFPSEESESSDAYADEASTATSTATSTVSSADVDAMLNDLENKLNRFAKMDDLSDEYDDLEDQILDLMDKIDDQDMSAAQEKRYDKLDDRFDNL